MEPMSIRLRQNWKKARDFAAGRLVAHEWSRSRELEVVARARRIAAVIESKFGCNGGDGGVVFLLSEIIRESEVSLGEMAEHFGPEMADVVALVSEPMMGPQSLWRNLYVKALAAGPDLARLTKIAAYLERIETEGDGEAGVGGEAHYFLMALRCHALSERVDRAAEALDAALQSDRVTSRGGNRLSQRPVGNYESIPSGSRRSGTGSRSTG